MNYLAHLALSPDHDAIRVGNLLGDFVKGTENSLRQRMPDDLVDGILMHRAIDKFTDLHPAFLASKTLLAPERLRYAGVVIDLIYDHFLSIHWDKFYDHPLDAFIQKMYTIIEANPNWQQGKLKQAFPYMKSQNWLGCYGSLEGIHLTFRRVSQHSRFTAPIADTHKDLTKHYDLFETHFHHIYRDLVIFVNDYKQNKATLP